MVLCLQMIMGGVHLVAEVERGLGRIESIGSDAGKEAQDKSGNEFSHGISLRCSPSNIPENTGLIYLTKRLFRPRPTGAS